MTEKHKAKQGECDECGYEGTVYNDPTDGHSIDDKAICHGCKTSAYELMWEDLYMQLDQVTKDRDLFLGIQGKY